MPPTRVIIAYQGWLSFQPRTSFPEESDQEEELLCVCPLETGPRSSGVTGDGEDSMAPKQELDLTTVWT